MQILDCYRIVTFVPMSHVEEVIDALCESDLLSYGNYKDVLWFSSVGTGQFTPVSGASPAQGNIGKRERVEEVRLEFSILRCEDKLKHLIDNVLIPAHPWEEPAIAIYETRETRSDLNIAEK